MIMFAICESQQIRARFSNPTRIDAGQFCRRLVLATGILFALTIAGQVARAAEAITPTPHATETPHPSEPPHITPTPTPHGTETPRPSEPPHLTPTPHATEPPRVGVQSLNISTRLQVETGENVAISGFMLMGNAPKRVALRGIGPSLQGLLGSVLSDPTLELRGPDNSLIAANDNWRDNPAS